MLFSISDVDVVECTTSSCSGNGDCKEENGGGVICECDPGWTDDDCGTDINECDGDPCENSGTCNNGENMFTCSCPAAWTGLTCGTGKLSFYKDTKAYTTLDVHTYIWCLISKFSFSISRKMWLNVSQHPS